jgi:uncharacterized membrane protein YedE/YeeE
MREPVFVGLSGLLLGFSLSRIGFSSWDEVHRMFTFADLRLLFTFGFAVVLLAVAWILIAKLTGATWSPRGLHPGTVIGGVVFGAGWSLSGACPAIALVQLGEGQLGALLTLAGIVCGNWLYSVVHERWFRWSAASCADV